MTEPGLDRTPSFIDARRSVRSFDTAPVSRATLDMLISAACTAPAPHHSRPWRFVIIDSAEGKESLAVGMAARWRQDLEADGIDDLRIVELVSASHQKLISAPTLILGCLTWDGLDRYPDEARKRAEWGMALLSLGAAVENLMLAASAVGLASCWIAAPIFCPEEARDALGLAVDWLPHALVTVGNQDPKYSAPPRRDIDLSTLRVHR